MYKDLMRRVPFFSLPRDCAKEEEASNILEQKNFVAALSMGIGREVSNSAYAGASEVQPRALRLIHVCAGVFARGIRVQGG